jgi:NADH:ubiquinone oxidoreductase subunit E
MVMVPAGVQQAYHCTVIGIDTITQELKSTCVGNVNPPFLDGKNYGIGTKCLKNCKKHPLALKKQFQNNCNTK